jgi:hypothetical protein
LYWQPLLLNCAYNVFRSLDVRPHRFEWKVFAGRNLLHSGPIYNDVNVAQRGTNNVKIANVPNTEFEYALKIVVDGVIRRSGPLLKIETHEVLFGFIPGKNNNLFGHSQLAGKEAPNELLTERSGSAGDDNPTSFQNWFHASFILS